MKPSTILTIIFVLFEAALTVVETVKKFKEGAINRKKILNNLHTAFDNDKAEAVGEGR